MFLKSLVISNDDTIIREIIFHKGINLIVDETSTSNLKESGNNVGKTTVLRLVDYCLGSKGTNIFQDEEFRKQTNTQVESFLKENNIVIELNLVENLDTSKGEEITIRRNFLKYSKKIQEINGTEIKNNKLFEKELKKIVFKSSKDKPSFKQIVSKNIRDEKSRLIHTLKVLNPYTSNDEYEALFLFWLGIDLDFTARKQVLIQEISSEEKLQKRLKKESTIQQLEQYLAIVENDIYELEETKNNFNLNESYEEDLSELNKAKGNINLLSSQIGRLQIRRELILESKKELEEDFAQIDVKKVEQLYQQAKSLIPNLQKSFQETLDFHNKMISEKLEFVTQDLPQLQKELEQKGRELSKFIIQEKSLSIKLIKTGAIEELEGVINDLNKAYENKGRFSEQLRLWNSSTDKLNNKTKELNEINQGIASKESLISNRIKKFNYHFASISNQLYNEQFVLSPVLTDKGYSLTISSISGNLGTGKKKGQILSFDLAYILFAEENDIPCLHFILHDQIENVHKNQITLILNKVVNEINCQLILSVLKNKLPKSIDVDNFKVLSLSQSDKLFRI